MLLLVGLGNPGRDYAGNRHNIGFMAADAIVRRHSFSPWRQKFSGEIAEGSVAGEKVAVLKPLTYMNESGRSVAAAAQFWKIEPKDIVVFHDELDLPPAKMRMKTGGGHAGHNGLRSIQAHLGPDFRRVRLGIGHPGAKELVTNWVLGDFAKADSDWLQALLDALADHLPRLVAGEDAAYQSDIALALQPERKAKEPKAPPPAEAAKPTGPSEASKNAMAETLRRLLAQKKR
ncbi:aminoacyl-tRNA hydrolase [Prosthecodimorpha staleyi]|uniref:Peptidyl-tRNA hydrolase n=1 Tax=Prosthecodimorpha staleyi TaxID=2840188 RepID=A0A947D727_9HYPH|nr:aminoacyl-tRNA hydrolase [Prosthecodimorpha staleyi]MBT9289297.1 aminoacyl-tRNA hydrolase [Prosthecodimorpha staleyi]